MTNPRIDNGYSEHQARKPVGQTSSVGFQVGVRRTLPLSQEQAWRLLTSPEGLSWWLGGLSALQLEPGQRFFSKEGTSGELRIVKPLEQLRLSWQRAGWEQASTLQIRLLAAAGGRTTISFHQEKLKDANVREQMKLYWKEVLARLTEKAKAK